MRFPAKAFTVSTGWICAEIFTGIGLAHRPVDSLVVCPMAAAIATIMGQMAASLLITITGDRGKSATKNASRLESTNKIKQLGHIEI